MIIRALIVFGMCGISFMIGILITYYATFKHNLALEAKNKQLISDINKLHLEAVLYGRATFVVEGELKDENSKRSIIWNNK
jgi:hypothetical protein